MGSGRQVENFSHELQQATSAIPTARAGPNSGVIERVVAEQALELRPRRRPSANHRHPRWDEERATRVR